MWEDSNDMILDLLDYLSNDSVVFPLRCPICGSNDGHVFMFKEKDDLGSCWVWCSKCKNYSHVRYKIPKWWQNFDKISVDDLEGKPLILEQNKNIIDSYLNDLLKKQKTK